MNRLYKVSPDHFDRNWSFIGEATQPTDLFKLVTTSIPHPEHPEIIPVTNKFINLRTGIAHYTKFMNRLIPVTIIYRKLP